MPEHVEIGTRAGNHPPHGQRGNAADAHAGRDRRLAFLTRILSSTRFARFHHVTVRALSPNLTIVVQEWPP